MSPGGGRGGEAGGVGEESVGDGLFLDVEGGGDGGVGEPENVHGAFGGRDGAA